MPKYVIVSITEVDASQREQNMGRFDERVSLWTLREECLRRVIHLLDPSVRDISRHFWYNEKFVPYEGGRKLLGDVTPASGVRLELHPDYYRVRLGRSPAKVFAIDPELTVADVIDYCLGKPGAYRCYELATPTRRTLFPERTLWEQQVLPDPHAQWEKKPMLILRRKRAVVRWEIALLILTALLGFAIGYLTR
jgi:hypothetical protein